MNTPSYEQLVVPGIKGLPPDALREITDFVYFLRRRAVDPQSFEEEQFRTLIKQDLSKSSENELKHLEAEFSGHKD